MKEDKTKRKDYRIDYSEQKPNTHRRFYKGFKDDDVNVTH